MAQKTRAQLVTLLNSKIISGGRQTTAQNVRDLQNAIIESLIDIIDDKDVNNGYLGITSSGIVNIGFIKSSAPVGNFLRDDGTWQTASGSSVTASNGLTLSAGNVKLGGNLTNNTDIDGNFDLSFGANTPIVNYTIVTKNLNLKVASNFVITKNGLVQFDNSIPTTISTGFYCGLQYLNFNDITGFTELGIGTVGSANRQFISIDGTKSIKIQSIGTYASSFAGIDGVVDYSANYTPTCFVQKTYVTTNFASITSLSAYQLLSQKAVANGYASLDGTGVVPAIQLPTNLFLLLTGGTITGNVNINGIESIQPVTGVTQITNGATVTTTNATVTTLQTIAITSNTVVGLESTITYKKLSGTGVGSVGDGTVIKLNTAVNNKFGVNVLDPIQNSYTGSTNAIVGVIVTYTISGSNILLSVNGVLNDIIEWKVITKINS